MDSLRSFYLLLILAGLASCQAILPNPKSPVHNEVAAFIEDIEKTTLPNGLEKNTVRNGKSQATVLKTPNMEHELALFHKAILSETYLQSYYTKDSSSHGPKFKGYTITYKANGEKPEVRTLRLWKEDGQIQMLEFEAIQDNYLYRNRVKGSLISKTDSVSPVRMGYLLDVSQKMLFEDEYSVTVDAKSL